MPRKNLGRVTVDVAGGVLSAPLVPNVFVNGKPIAVIGTPIAPHGKFPHSGAKMETGSPNVKAGGFFVCGSGDLASCGHPLVSTSNVFIN